jgi:hypothetical protein
MKGTAAEADGVERRCFSLPVCHHEECGDIAWWPNAAIPGDLPWELPLPRHFEALCESLVDEADVARSVVCSADAATHVEAIRKFVDAGIDHVYVHQVGPDQTEFFRFYSEKVLPEFE